MFVFSSTGLYGLREIGENAATKRWFEKAVVDFSEMRFVTENIEINGSASIAREPTTFGFEKNYIHPKPSFQGFVFPSTCDFWATTIASASSFEDTIFYGFAGFRRTTFGDTVSFERATFHQAAWFARTRFVSVADFSDAVFLGWARFAGVAFDEATIFERAKFSRAWFRGTDFSKRAVFDNCVFWSEADFAAVSVNQAFDMRGAKFSEVPRFNQSSFKEAPDLDNVEFPLPDYWRGHQAGNIANYRHLRRLAIDGIDYENESKAFKGEVRSKRGTEHKWYHAAFWYGAAYDAFSDFGRSMSRPFCIWAASTVIFAIMYLLDAGKLAALKDMCNLTGGPSYYASALVLSLKNAIPIIGIDSKAEHVAHDCLYGISIYGGIAIQGLQKIWSAVLIFLILLAVRNQFKIK